MTHRRTLAILTPLLLLGCLLLAGCGSSSSASTKHASQPATSAPASAGGDTAAQADARLSITRATALGHDVLAFNKAVERFLRTDRECISHTAVSLSGYGDCVGPSTAAQAALAKKASTEAATALTSLAQQGGGDPTCVSLLKSYRSVVHDVMTSTQKMATAEHAGKDARAYAIDHQVYPAISTYQRASSPIVDGCGLIL